VKIGTGKINFLDKNQNKKSSKKQGKKQGKRRKLLPIFVTMRLERSIFCTLVDS